MTNIAAMMAATMTPPLPPLRTTVWLAAGPPGGVAAGSAAGLFGSRSLSNSAIALSLCQVWVNLNAREGS